MGDWPTFVGRSNRHSLCFALFVRSFHRTSQSNTIRLIIFPPFRCSSTTGFSPNIKFKFPIFQSIFNLFASYWGLRFGLLNWFYPLYQGMPSWLLNFFLFTNFYTYHIENLSTTILLFNRFTSIVFAFSYEKVEKIL